MGRPSLYTPEVVETICEQLAQGIPLTVICREEGMPDPATVWRWKEEMPDVSQAIARARELGEYALAEQCLAIADDETHDWALSKKGPVTDDVAIARAKLRVDTRLKLLAKFNPKRWGEKIELAGNAEQPLQVVIQRKAPPVEGEAA